MDVKLLAPLEHNEPNFSEFYVKIQAFYTFYFYLHNRYLFI